MRGSEKINLSKSIKEATLGRNPQGGFFCVCIVDTFDRECTKVGSVSKEFLEEVLEKIALTYK